MKIETIKYEEKFSKTQFEPVLIGFSAILTEQDNAVDVLSDLKRLAHNFFHTQVMGRQPEPQGKNVPTQDPRTMEQKEAEASKEVEVPKKAKKTKAAPVEDKKHGDVIDGQEVPPVIPTEAQEEMETVESPFQLPKDAIAYDLKNKDHRDRFAAYLTKTFPNWKTKPKEQLLAMSQELSGKAFEDKKGVMLDSFKNIVASFFE